MPKKRRHAKGAAAHTHGVPTPPSPALVRSENLEMASASPSHAPPPASSARAPARSRSRALSNAFIALFLLFQVAMPLRYYLLGGGYDERFSWRMFSTLRMQKCQVQVDDVIVQNGKRTPRRLDLRATLHGAWINILQRYRPAAVDKLLLRRCATAAVVAARYVRHCESTDGRKLPSIEVEMDCQQGSSRIVRGAP
jgi:hypothetical protein